MYSLFVGGFGIKDFFRSFFFCCCFVGLQFVRWFLQVLYVCQSFGCQNIASGSLVWCVRFQGLNVRGFLWVWFFSLRFGYHVILRFS